MVKQKLQRITTWYKLANYQLMHSLILCQYQFDEEKTNYPTGMEGHLLQLSKLHIRLSKLQKFRSYNIFKKISNST